MKLGYITCVMMLLICVKGFTQSNPRIANENYMYTVFYDGFDETALNRNVWNVSCNGKKDGGLNIWVDGANTVNQANGSLDLSQLDSPGYTITLWNNSTITADYIAGEVASGSSFLYGSFECRAKYANQRGSWPAFWLYGGDGVPCPNGNACEIDISELWNITDENIFGCHSKLKLENNCHHAYPSSACEISNVNHWYTASMGSSMDDNFHVYKCVWTPDKVDFYMDNVLKSTALKVSSPFDFPYLPLHVTLSQQVPPLPCGYITCPQTSSFDYVRVKQFFLAPEITCPTIICTTETATMDVASEATNISWALTPSNLFSGATTGSGTTANITASSCCQGKGKITYTFSMPSGETYTSEKDIWIKGPDVTELSFDVFRSDGIRATKVGSTFLMCPNTNYQIYLMNRGPVPLSNYTWTVPSAWTRNYTYQNIISVNTNSSPGGQVIVTATNTTSGCSNTILPITGYMGSNYSCGSYYMSFTPNPATSETTLELSADGEKVVNDKTIWELEVIDQMQSLKEKKTKLKGNQTKINTSSWKDGVYIVRAKIGEKLLSEKLVVKH
jgi:beta-glucanase (GH16 family)